jgi:hypothetical protein
MNDKITLRWRVHDGQIPLFHRHLRTLQAFEVSPPLLAWVHERIEWAKDNLLGSTTNGILVLAIDPRADAVVTYEELREPPDLTLGDLCLAGGATFASVKPELGISAMIVAQIDDKLVALSGAFVSATATLLRDIAQTLSIDLELASLCLDDLATAQAVFAISDEFGFLPIGKQPTDPQSPAARIASAFAKLW